MKTVLVGCWLLLSCSCVCRGAAEPSRSVIECSGGPVITECSPAGAEAVLGVSVQYTWLQRPERESTAILVARYRHGPFVGPASVSWGPPEPGGLRSLSRGDIEPRSAHFAEFGAGVRSSGAAGLWFGEFEAGLAAIRFARDDDDPIREKASPYLGVRLGTAWPPRSRLSVTAAVALRVYPGVDHVAAGASVGVAVAPWGAGAAVAPGPDERPR